MRFVSFLLGWFAMSYLAFLCRAHSRFISGGGIRSIRLLTTNEWMDELMGTELLEDPGVGPRDFTFSLFICPAKTSCEAS